MIDREMTDIRAVYDDTGGIGKLYARQDEIGPLEVRVNDYAEI